MSEASKRDQMRGLLAQLTGLGLTEFGSVINGELVHHILGIEMPMTAPKSVYDQLALIELTCIDYCRNVLLGEGKYLSGTPSGYRILLPSENKKQIEGYVGSADRKLNRALKLSRNSPVDTDTHDQIEARIMLKQSERRYPRRKPPEDDSPYIGAS
jgi:hypothetical protein